ncbi:MAG: HD domain-containing phosphohydrolase [Nitrospirota bacterium]
MQESEQHETYKILFVDDEENVLRSLKRLFLDHDVDVFTASSGKEGIELLKKHEIAVIVSDQRMPEMSGAEFLEKAARLSPDSVRIVLTGYADVTAAMDAINKGGAYRYATKPWDDNEFTITVLNAIERYRLVRENRRLTELTRKQNEELKKWGSELELYVQQQTIDLTNQNKELKKLNERLNKNFKDFISAFYNLIELRNKSLYVHSNNVATLVSDIVQKMGLPVAEAEVIISAAQLHDIGKVGISDSVLIKSVKELDPDEKADYMKHPIIGQAVIDSIEGLRNAGVLIRHHHEWYNGDGFPDKLKFEKIPFGSRIIALADRFDNLTFGSNEPRGIEKALKQIQTLLGLQFDPELYKPFSEVVQERITAVIPEEDEVNIEVELKPQDLVSGLVLSRDVRSGTGLLLLRKETILNERNIETMKRGYHLDPSKSGVFVWMRRKKEHDRI